MAHQTELRETNTRFPNPLEEDFELDPPKPTPDFTEVAMPEAVEGQKKVALHPTCSVEEQRQAWLKHSKGKTHVILMLRGDCVICGHRRGAAIHSNSFRRGAAIPFHDYTPPNKEF